MTRTLDELFVTTTQELDSCLHIIDVENLAGTGWLTTSCVREVCLQWAKTTKCSKEDVFLIAAGPQNREAAFSGWSLGKRIFKFEKGQDGADNALKTIFQLIANPKAFNHLYLGSGDHGLEHIAKRSKSLGLPVTVVTGKGAMAHQYNKYQHVQMELI